MLGKKQRVFGKPDKFRKFALAIFFKFDLVFPQLGGKGGNWMKFKLLFIVTSGKTCEKTKSKFKKNGQREISKCIWLFKTLFVFP